MIEVYDRMISEIPVLEVVQSDLKNDELPLVVFYHGWTNVKEQVLLQGYEIAKKGFRVLLPEAIYHGKRQDEKTTKEHTMDFWEIIKGSVAEFPIITNFYITQGLANKERLGVAGASMGGITTCALMTTYDYIKAADCLMGSPNLKNFAEKAVEAVKESGIQLPADTDTQLAELVKYDLSLKPEKIAGRPFHFWHGKEDPVVPFQATFSFYETMKLTESGRNLSFTSTEDGHRVPYIISQETATFFEKHL